MSASFEIRAASGTYTARIQAGSLDEVVERGGDIVILCDAWFADRFEGRGLPVISLPALESTKSLDEIPRIIMALREAGASRRTRLIAGGLAEIGVVFLMFMIGLELSLDRLWSARVLVFGMGSLQIIVTAGGEATTRPVRDGTEVDYDYALGQEFGWSPVV